MGKVVFALVLVMFLGTARCYNADFAGAAAGLPLVGAMVAPPPTTPAYVKVIGTPAADKLPTADLSKWFPANATDPYDPVMWASVRDVLAFAGTQAGFTEVCKLASTAAGANRTAHPEVGAIACSADPSVTGEQPFAIDLLDVRAELALWVKGAPGSSVQAIGALQGEIAVLCGGDAVARNGGPASPFAQACAKAADTSYLKGDAKTTFTALGDASTLIAGDIATKDPKVAATPAFFGATATP
ncbi:MAG: hypothetical protein ACRDG3_07115 [Tepidiformaceae bacterium]